MAVRGFYWKYGYRAERPASTGSGKIGYMAIDTRERFIEAQGLPATWIDITPEAGSATWESVSGKPSAFPPSAHDHDDRYLVDIEIAELLSLKADLEHGHDIADTTGLQAALDAKAATSHTHTALQLGGAGADATKFLRGDLTWAL